MSNFVRHLIGFVGFEVFMYLIMFFATLLFPAENGTFKDSFKGWFYANLAIGSLIGGSAVLVGIILFLTWAFK
jgi:hypothetical protein